MQRLCGIVLAACVIAGVSTAAYANKSAVEIQAPETAKKGSTITISVTVTHSGNSIVHYTNWVYIKANGKEIARWDFTWNNRPENEVFTCTVTYTVTGPVEIEAESNCNLHGSAGAKTFQIKVQ